MILCDNDIISKLAEIDLLDEFLQVWSIGHSEIQVLRTAKNVLLRRRDNNEHPAKHRIEAFLDQVQPITYVLSDDELAIVDASLGIDQGEAILFVTAARHGYRVATGDKRSLRALASQHPSLCSQLAGRVICLEQTVLKIIGHLGYAEVLRRVVQNQSSDTALRAAFGSGIDALEANVRPTLEAYFSELQGLRCPSLFQCD